MNGADPFYMLNGRCFLYYVIRARHFGFLEAVTCKTGISNSIDSWFTFLEFEDIEKIYPDILFDLLNYYDPTHTSST